MSSQTPPKEETAPAFRVLTIVARPLDAAELPDISEAWALVEGLSKIEAPALIHFLEPPTIENLRSVVLDGWDVIHFDGHGGADKDGGVLAFEKEDGTSDTLSALEFVDMLERSGSIPRLVILSACESATGAHGGLAGVLQLRVPAVVGTKESVTVLWTMRLARQLYAALGRGRPIRDAFGYAREALRDLPNYNPSSETPSAELPVLVGKGIDATLCDGRRRGEPVIEPPRLYGWTERWEGKFHGDYVTKDEEGRSLDPPGGRKGLIVRAARALLRDEKLVVLTGPGGIGKTALAAKVARNIAWRYPGGVFWVDGRNYVTGTIPLDAVLDEFEHVLGKAFLELPTERKRMQVLAYMNGLKSACLVVLDNADTAGDKAMRFLQELPPRSAALLTSRVAPEYGGTMIELKAMSRDESLTLLLAEVGRRKNDPSWYMRPDKDGQPEVALDDAEWGRLLEITRLLGGHPLALLLAAARIAGDGIERTHAIVQKHPALGKELHKRFDFSYTPLSDDEKRLLHLIAAFPADFDEAALEGVCTDETLLDGDEALNDWDSGLRDLRNKSLVEQLDINKDYRRFRLHPVLRDYVREKMKLLKLTASDGRAISGADLLSSNELKVARFYATLSFTLYQQFTNPERAHLILRTVNVERYNMSISHETFYAQGHWKKVTSLCDQLDHLFDKAGHWQERRKALELALDAATKLDDPKEIRRAKHNLAILMQWTGDLVRAKQLFEDCYSSRDPKNSKEETAPLFHLGVIAYEMGMFDEAERLLKQGLAIVTERKEQVRQGLFLNRLGVIAREKGDLDAARKYVEEALTISTKSKFKLGIASAHHSLGRLAQIAQDYPNARRHYKKSLAKWSQTGDLPNWAQTAAQLSLLDEDEGKYHDALKRIRQAEVIIRQTGDPISIRKIESQIKRLEKQLEDEKDEPPAQNSPSD